MNTGALLQVTTATEVAEMFGVTTAAVRKSIRVGRLYAQRSGNVHLILVKDALDYYERQPEWPERLRSHWNPES